MKTKSLAFFILTAAAAILLIAALFCHIPSATAYAADERAEFCISTADGEHWTLLCGEETIGNETGVFFRYGSTNAVSVKFEKAIKDKLAELGMTDYILNFVLPDITAEIVGQAEFDYSEVAGGGGTLVKAQYDCIISTDVQRTLQYRSGSEAFETYPFSEEREGGLTFGSTLDVGDYGVRFALYEIFVFDGVRYSVPRYSPEIGCTVLQAKPTVPDLGTVQVEYGIAAADIPSAFYDFSGDWTISAEQNIPELADGNNARLRVKEGGYAVKFDYAPHNKNYKSAIGVEVSINVFPRTLRVYISDEYSLAGEPVKTDLKYAVNTPLAEGDELSDLGVELYIENIDKDTPGKYVIKARFANPDYTPQCFNYTNSFVDGGRYTVYATRLTVTAFDGSVFEVYMQSGIIGMSLRIVDYGQSPAMNGYTYVAGYDFIFENENDERVFPESDYAVYIERLNVSATDVAVVDENGGTAKFGHIDDNFVEVPRNMRALVFFVADEMTETARSPYEVAAYVMAGLCSALTISLAALLAVFAKSRRYFG